MLRKILEIYAFFWKKVAPILNHIVQGQFAFKLKNRFVD